MTDRLTTVRGRIALAAVCGGSLFAAATFAAPAVADSAQVQMAGTCDQYQQCNFTFAPGQITVPAGSTVTWVNSSQAPHTATSNSGDPQSFDTGKLAPGGQASVTLNAPGTYYYHCIIHPYMQGTIIVTGSGATTGPTPPPPPAGTPTPTASATFAPTATETPAATATVAAAPLNVKASVSPRTVHPGGKFALRVHGTVGAHLTMNLAIPGERRAVRHGTVPVGGTYRRSFRVPHNAHRGRATVKVTARLAGKSVTAVVRLTVH